MLWEPGPGMVGLLQKLPITLKVIQKCPGAFLEIACRTFHRAALGIPTPDSCYPLSVALVMVWGGHRAVEGAAVRCHQQGTPGRITFRLHPM
jgi:hypothetical protein